jgi:hypothetical protein
MMKSRMFGKGNGAEALSNWLIFKRWVEMASGARRDRQPRADQGMANVSEGLHFVLEPGTPMKFVWDSLTDSAKRWQERGRFVSKLPSEKGGGRVFGSRLMMNEQGASSSETGSEMGQAICLCASIARRGIG